MKLVCKGRFTGEEQLPKGDLPPDAVPYREPGTPQEVNRAAMVFLLPVLLFAVLLWALRGLVQGTWLLSLQWTAFVGMASSLLLIVPHELVHALCFPRGAVVELYLALKSGMAFVVSTHPLSKRHFIWMSLAPSLLFGVAPLLVWALLPLRAETAAYLFWLGLMNLTMGIGDFMNVWNTLCQVPRGAMTQLSGFHSYWFRRKDG